MTLKERLGQIKVQLYRGDDWANMVEDLLEELIETVNPVPEHLDQPMRSCLGDAQVGQTSDEIECVLVPWSRGNVRDHLDRCIRFWRIRKIRADAGGDEAGYTMAIHYVDAYQSVRSSLFGEVLPPEGAKPSAVAEMVNSHVGKPQVDEATEGPERLTHREAVFELMILNEAEGFFENQETVQAVRDLGLEAFRMTMSKLDSERPQTTTAAERSASRRILDLEEREERAIKRNQKLAQAMEILSDKFVRIEALVPEDPNRNLSGSRREHQEALVRAICHDGLRVIKHA